MRAAAPGSLPWLLRHELRLTWRSYLAAWGRGADERKARRRLIGLLIFFHLLAVPIALAAWMSPVEETPGALLFWSGALLLVWSLMLSQSLYGVTQALYMRGDLDLLLSSPLSARRMLTVRALAIAMNAVTAWALLALPFVDLLIVTGQFHWIAVYPMLLALGTTATAAGLALAMALFAAIGPARTRNVAQVLAAVIGVAAFLISQAQNFLPETQRAAVTKWLASLTEPSRFDASGSVWLPARALLGELGPLVLCLVAALAVFGLAVWAFGRAFAANATAIAGLATYRPQRGPSRRPSRAFRGGLNATLLRKEWRLLVRDPWLLSQILMQIIYLLPLCLIYWRQTRSDQAVIGGLAMMAVVIAGHLAGGLIWITISSEDSPELLASAPIEGRAVLRAKLLAALGPVAGILALPLIAIGTRMPAAGLWGLVGCLASGLSATLLGLWYQKPAKRKAFMQRRKGSTVVNLAEMVMNFAWGLATAFAISGSPWALAFVAAALGTLFGLRLIAKPGPILALA
jgi:ABC-2 type transport system permease protein